MRVERWLCTLATCDGYMDPTAVHTVLNAGLKLTAMGGSEHVCSVCNNAAELVIKSR